MTSRIGSTPAAAPSNAARSLADRPVKLGDSRSVMNAKELPPAPAGTTWELEDATESEPFIFEYRLVTTATTPTGAGRAAATAFDAGAAPQARISTPPLPNAAHLPSLDLGASGPSLPASFQTNVKSAYAKPNSAYIDTPIDTLVSTRHLGERQFSGSWIPDESALKLAKRLGELATPPVTDGVLRVSTLQLAERPDVATLLNSYEKDVLPKLWDAIRAEASPAVEKLELPKLPSLEHVVDASFVPPKPLDLTAAVGFGSVTLRADEATLLDRTQKLSNPDGKEMTVSLADIDAALASTGITPNEKTMLQSLRTRVAEQLRLVPPKFILPQLMIMREYREEKTATISSKLGLEATVTPSFDGDLQFKRETKLNYRGYEALTVRREDGSIAAAIAGSTTGPKSTPVDLPPGKYFAQVGDKAEVIAFEVPAGLGTQTADFSRFSAYSMSSGVNATPDNKGIFEHEVDDVYVGNRFDTRYFTPGGVVTNLPPGQYSLPGTDLTVLLNSRNTGKEYSRGAPDPQIRHNHTQVLIIDGQGQPHSVTGRKPQSLPDGRAVSAQADKNGGLSVTIGGQRFDVALLNRIA